MLPPFLAIGPGRGVLICIAESDTARIFLFLVHFSGEVLSNWSLAETRGFLLDRISRDRLPSPYVLIR